MIRRTFLTVAVLALLTAHADAQTIAQLSYPSNGATNVDTTQPFTWNSVSGALAYYLYVGSSQGAKDLYNSGEIQLTSLRVPNLPVDSTIWLRLWTKTSSGWASGSDVSFTAAKTYVPPALFTYPTNGLTNADTANRTFSWTTASGAVAYELTVGTTSGANDLFDSGRTTSTSTFVPSLPKGVTLYARIGTQSSTTTWSYSDISFVATTSYAPRAQLTFPADGATNVDTTQLFTWNAVSGSLAYYLYVGSAQGAKDLYNSGEVQTTSVLVPSLPVGTTIWVRLWTKLASGWVAAPDLTFVAGASYTPPATFLYPTNGATADTANQQFKWTTSNGAIAYRLTVGTTAGASDLFDSGSTVATSMFVPALPTGVTLYARLGTQAGDTLWRYVDITFSATTTYAPRAQVTFPSNGASNVDTRQPITWNPVSGALAYYLYVGSTQGAKDLYNSGEIQATSLVVPNLPLGTAIWLRLWTKTTSGWVAAPDVNFVASASYVPPSTFLYPTNAMANADTANQQFKWTAVPNALAYELIVGRTTGANDLFDSGETRATAMFVPSLPIGTTLYARLGTKDSSGLWSYTSISFIASTTYVARAQMTYPTNNATNVDTTQPLTWSPVTGALAYYLYVGSSQGMKDLYNVGEVQTTSATVPNLPIGAAIWVRLWTKTAAGWFAAPDVTFVAATSYVPPATFVYPTNGMTGADTANQQFRWTSVPGALAYCLRVGTTSGAADIFDSGEIQDTNIWVPSVPTGVTVYAQLGTKGAGSVWTYNNITFTASSTYVLRSVFTYPQNSSTAVDTTQPFTWTAVPNADAYYLYVGTTFRGSDVDNSGEISATQRWVRNAPANVPLFATIYTEVNGRFYPTDIQFTVTNNALASFESRFAVARSLADQVRRMAGTDNIPLLGTLLDSIIKAQGKTTAFCSDYASALQQLVIDRQLFAIRIPQICLNTNRSDLFDCHAITEVLDESSGRWIVVDPTFALVARIASTGAWATAADISSATQAGNFSAITYMYLNARGSAWAEEYYLDYPLLYSNVFSENAAVDFGQGNAITPYLAEVTLPTSTQGIYVLQTDSGNGAPVQIDGVQRTVPCDGIQNTSTAFLATSITMTSSSDRVHAYVVRRFQFPNPMFFPLLTVPHMASWISPETDASFRHWSDRGKSHLWTKNNK